MWPSGGVRAGGGGGGGGGGSSGGGGNWREGLYGVRLGIGTVIAIKRLLVPLLILALVTDATFDDADREESLELPDLEAELEERVYTFGTIQIEPLYSQYGDGFIRNLTDRIAKRLGIRHKIVSYSATNGAWDNLVHTVANGEIDVGASLLTMTGVRQKEVSFSTPFLTSTLSALYHGNRGLIRDPTELLSSGFKIGTVNSSSVLDVMADSPKTYVQEILSVILNKAGNLVHTVHEGIHRARHQNYVFILDTVLANYYASQKPCELRLIKLTDEIFSYSFITRPGSPLHTPMSDVITDMEHDQSLPELIKTQIFQHIICQDDER